MKGQDHVWAGRRDAVPYGQGGVRACGQLGRYQAVGGGRCGHRPLLFLFRRGCILGQMKKVSPLLYVCVHQSPLLQALVKGAVALKKKKVLSREALLDALFELATAPINDAVSLAFSPDLDPLSLQKLRLMGLAEFKRNANGTMELKFQDRLPVFQVLLSCLQEEQNTSTLAFLEALQSDATGKTP